MKTFNVFIFLLFGYFMGSCDCQNVRIFALLPKGIRACVTKVSGLETFNFYGYIRKKNQETAKSRFEGEVTRKTDGQWCYVNRNVLLHVNDELVYWYRVTIKGIVHQSEPISNKLKSGDFLAESGSFDWESTRNTPSRPTVTPSTTTKISVINKLFNNFSPFSHKKDTDQSTTPRDIIPQHMTSDLATISEPLYDVFPTVPAKPQNQPIIPTYNVKPSEIALVDGNSPPMSKNSENSEKDTNSFKQEVGSDILEEIFTSAIPEDMKFDESDADECRSLSNIDPMIDWRFLPSCPQVKITETTSTKKCEDSLKSAKKLNEVLLKSYEIAVQTVNSLEIELSESRIASKHLNDTITEAINIINKLNSKRSATNMLILKSSLRLVEYERTLYDVISNHLKINRDLYRVTKISKKPDCNAVVFELSKFSEKLRILLTSRIALTGSKFEIIDYDGVDINMLA